MKMIQTSESVTEGHPDKMCDFISDSILDEAIKQDKNSRVACETLATKGVIFVAGEITTKAQLNINRIVREAVKRIGYNDEEFGLNYKTVGVMVAVQPQSPDIAMGVDRKKKLGAGDQGIMVGYATDETKEMMPLPTVLANKLTQRLAYVRKKGIVKGLGPDGKSQVSVEYKNGKPIRITNVIIATQHRKEKDVHQLRKEIFEKVVKPVCAQWLDKRTKIIINGTGRFVLGGPSADTGLTGRKIVIDNYGPSVPVGGGAFSGKDATKVDRSAAYMARYVAKNLVKAGACSKCRVTLSYAIGVEDPTSIDIETYGTGRVHKEEILRAVKKVFSFKPKDIIKTLRLREPIFSQTSAYGHFGRDKFTWEKTNKVRELRKELNL